ncbi:MAG: ATP-binding protein [Oligoflexus sp.]
MSKAYLLLTFFLLLSASTLTADNQDVACDSCLFQVNDLQKPFPLKGNWLFTRDDDIKNREIDADTSNWQIISTPGNWEKSYNDGKYFRVGWYRGVLEFDEELIGKEVVFLVDVYMSQIEFFLDGKQIYQRNKGKVDERFFSIQPIPIRFHITKKNHVVAFRINTILMTGVYQLPFQLREYRSNDIFLAAFQTWGGEVRLISAYVILAFGIFFLIIYLKIKHSLYLVAGLSGILIYPFYAFPSDAMIRFYDPESLQILHYVGIGFMALFHSYFAQFFYKFYPRINKVNTSVIVLLAFSFPLLLIKFDLQLFQILRKFLFIYSLIIASHYIYVCYQAMRKNRHNIILFVTEMIFYLSSIHDTLLALGVIKSIALIFTGTGIATFGIMIKSSQIFAKTFIQNKSLLKKIERTNQNLEQLVRERTHELEIKSDNIRTILTQVPAGILTLNEELRIETEYSQHLEVILNRKNLGGEEIVQCLFQKSNLTADLISRMTSTLICSVGEDGFNFDANFDSLPNKIIANFKGVQKSLELDWAPIQDLQGHVEKILLVIRDVTLVKELEESMKRNQRELEIIGQILRIPRNKFRDCMNSIKGLVLDCESFLKNQENSDQAKHRTCLQKLHTIKGIARTYELGDISTLVHMIEDELSIDPSNNHQDVLEAAIRKVRDVIGHYEKISNEKLGFQNLFDQDQRKSISSLEEHILEISRSLEASFDHEPREMKKLLRKVQENLVTIATFSIEEIMQPIIDSLPSLAKELDKPTPHVTIDGVKVAFSRPLAEQIKEVLIHIFRNILDHGIEDAATRLANRKGENGLIIFQGVVDHDYLLLRIWDDGQGLNLKRLKEKGIKTGILKADQEYQKDDIAQLIFEEGLSTKEQINEISGRGLGMSFVKQTIEDIGGDIKIIFRRSKNKELAQFCFQISIPLASTIKISSTLPRPKSA